MKYTSYLLAASFLLGASPLLHAQTVAWGGTASPTPVSYTSDGLVDNNGAGTQTLIWTLGWFDDSFIPDSSNFLLWADSYNQVDTTTHRVSGPFWNTQKTTSDVGAAAAGKEMYIFAYNNLGSIGTPSGQALLFRQIGLKFPVIPNSETFDLADAPASTDDAFEVVWGQVDRKMGAANANVGVLQGGGTYSLKLNDSGVGAGSGTTFESQSATWPVPEVSSSLLGIMGSILLLNRRRRL